MIRPTFYVGLGGTGAQTILRIKQLYIEAYGEFPSMANFLVIDTDMTILNESIISKHGNDVKLSESEICVLKNIFDFQQFYYVSNERFDWMPNRNVRYIPTTPANCHVRVRTSARFILWFYATYIENLIKIKIDEFISEIYTNRDDVKFPIEVKLVSSVAGGTGSGMFVDVLVLLAKILRQKKVPYSIQPWLVMPDVFRSMLYGPGHVYQNAYGVMRELDYLYHLPKDNSEPVDFLFDSVYSLGEGVDKTYLINNINENSYLNIEQITDSISRSIFQSSISSREIDAFLAHIKHKLVFENSVLNKQAHYASAGSADIVYDNQAVGNVIAKGIVCQICNELVGTALLDALQEVTAWTISESVAIQEHGTDLFTDSILAKYAPFPVILDRDSDLNTVNASIFAGAEADNVIAEARNNEANKLEAVKAELVVKINAILNSQNGVGVAKAFLRALLYNIAECKEKMNMEKDYLQATLAYEVDWASEIVSLRRGLFKIFSEGEAELLQYRINDYIALKRDLLRHKYAIQFYTDFEVYVNDYLERISVFMDKLVAVKWRQERDIVAIRCAAKSSSPFQIFLHTDEVCNFTLPEVSEIFALFRNETPIYELVEKSEKELNEIFFNFAKEQNSVIEAANVSIEEKISRLSESQLKEIFVEVKYKSSPLWSRNVYGYPDYASKPITLFVIGVCDLCTSIIQNECREAFKLGYNDVIFSSTYQPDKITVLQCQFYSPAYAVNNMLDYRKEYLHKTSLDTHPVAYLDENWNQRMMEEDFDIMPNGK